MEAVIDSVSISDLLRKPKAGGGGGARMETSLDPYIRCHSFRVAMDRDRAIIDEWCRTCGDEHVHVLVTKWVDMGGFRCIDAPGKVPVHIMKRLKLLGFKDGPIDKLLLRTAMGSVGRRLVSRDRDFWNPGDLKKHPVGDPAGSVASLCRTELQVTITTLTRILSDLGRNAG